MKKEQTEKTDSYIYRQMNIEGSMRQKIRQMDRTERKQTDRRTHKHKQTHLYTDTDTHRHTQILKHTHTHTHKTHRLRESIHHEPHH